MSNIEFFNQLVRGTNNYLNMGRMFSLNFRIYEQTFEDIDSKLQFHSSDVVLDAGGGCGQITRFISEKSKRVILLDGASEAMSVAKRDLRQYGNVEYCIWDIATLPLPYPENYFDKILCYSVVHYLSDHQVFEALLLDFLRILKPKGKILIGDIPLQDKYDAHLQERSTHPLKNFFLNQKYLLRKAVTQWFYQRGKVDSKLVQGLRYTTDSVQEIMSSLPRLDFQILPQNLNLPFADSRADLLIIKHAD